MNRGFEELVTMLSNGMSHRSLYFSAHPKVRSSAADFQRQLRELLDGAQKDGFFLGIVNGRLVHEGHFLLGSTLVGKRIIQFNDRLRAGGLLFKRPVSIDELCSLFEVAAELKEPLRSLDEARAMLQARGVTNVEISPPYDDPAWFGQFLFKGTDSLVGEIVEDEGDATMITVYQSLFEAVEVAHSKAAGDHEIDIAGARTMSEKLVATTAETQKDILQLVQYADYDAYTVGHSVRVALLAVMVGRALGMPSQLLTELGTAGILHDVGKSKIAPEILFKRARLDADEQRVMAQHPCLGAQILLENDRVGPLAIGAAWGHHLRHDRGGYPEMPAWAVRSRVTALVQACDVYEALTAVRPYKPALPPRRVYEIMLADRHAFDAGALDALIRTLGLYPPGSHVRLSSGEQATVTAAGRRIDRPRVEVTHSADGRRLPPADRRPVDLGAPAGAGLVVAELLEVADTAGLDPAELAAPRIECGIELAART
jgi:HD-GYP domain-containing protein (c-di-GMP phosphodiesterase class II)